MDKKRITLEELDGILKSERLTEVFDVLEPKARRLSKQPLNVSYSIMFGSLFLAISVVGGHVAMTRFSFPALIVGLAVFALTSAGLCAGQIVSLGREGRRLERRGRALERFVRPLLPLLVQINRRVATKSLNKQLADAIFVEIAAGTPYKRLTPETEEEAEKGGAL